MKSDNSPIYVDLDGTLVRSDMFLESVIRAIKRNPLILIQLILHLFKGRAAIKEYAARATDIDVSHVPLQTEVLDYLTEQKNSGRPLFLATAAHRLCAEALAERLGIFDDILATDGGENLKGARKLAAIRDHAGGKAFTYAGDSAADRPIWQAATSNILVNAPTQDIQAAITAKKAEKIIGSRPSPLKAFRREMRIHQYAKNVLIFVPLFTAHQYQNADIVLSAILAFIAFSLCASGVYFINDLLDIDADRRHASKRHRPVASGDLPLPLAFIGACLLPATAIGLAVAFLPLAFLGVLILYLLITNAYSLFIKRVSTADVMTLAILFTSRVVAGAAATGIALSSWLMAFSVFVFVSLAYLKRYIEVSALSDESGEKAGGRGYSAADTESMFSLGIANITASC